MTDSHRPSCEKTLAYKILYAKGVQQDLEDLPKAVQRKALELVEDILTQDPLRGKPLTGAYKGLWKYRLGDYRIIYTIERQHATVSVLRIRHRKEVYRRI